MQLLAVVAAITALCASQASATCYSGGAFWPDTGDANTKLIDACKTQLVGTYGPGEDRKACRNGNDAIRYDFEVHNMNDIAATLSLDACVDNTRREIYHCGQGGHEVFGNVYFRYVSFRILK